MNTGFRETLRPGPGLPQKRTYLCVQALRGLAAVMVVVHHATQTWLSKTAGLRHNSGWANGASGVDIFFIISGFVMVISTSGGKKPTAWQFLSRRVIRIVPLYWLLSFVAILDQAIKAGVRYSSTLSVPLILSSLVFLPSKRPDAAPGVVLGVGWTLCFEMFFYLLFSVALYCGFPRFRFLAAVMIPLSLAGIFYQDSWPAISFFLNPIVLEFLGGILIANVVLRGIKLHPALITVLGITGFALLLTTPDFDIVAPSARALVWGVPAFMVVAAVVSLESRFRVRVPSWLLAIGDSSYSLYLLHGFLIQLLIAVFVKAHFPYRYGVVFVATVVVVSAMAAHLLYQLFEVPVARWLKGFIVLRDPAPEPSLRAIPQSAEA